jgi:hypothetical protein
LAEKVVRVAEKLGINSKIKNLQNPRSEKESKKREKGTLLQGGP